MKTIKNSSIIITLLTLVSFAFYACSNNDAKSVILDEIANQKELFQDTTIPSDMGGLKFGSLLLPKGTISKISQNGSRLDFKLPENYVYAAKDATGKVFFAIEGSYTCTSTCSGGCDVLKLGDNIGCSACPAGSTEPCVGQRGKRNVQKSDKYSHQIGDGNDGGLINLKNGISFITTRTARNKRILPENTPNFEFLTKHPKIKAEFDLFFNEMWDGELPNENNSKPVLVNFYGKVISLLIPIEIYQTSEIQFIAGDTISCSCSSDTGACILKPIKKTFVIIGYTCVAGDCTSCTMNL